MVITSVVGMGAKSPGQPASEDVSNPHNPRSVTEQAAKAVAERGVNVSIVRLAQVHNQVKQGFVSRVVEVARATGISAFIGEGSYRWAAVRVDDPTEL